MDENTKKEIEKAVAEHIAEKATELSKKSPNKYISWLFRAIATIAMALAAYTMTNCSFKAENLDVKIYPPIEELGK